jgi:hypothetical protein
MTMPDPIQPEQPRREFKNCSGDFLNIRLTARTWFPSDFLLFGPLKNHLGGQRFTDDEEVETDVWEWLRQQTKDFYDACFDGLVKRWDKCIKVGRGYVE